MYTCTCIALISIRRSLYIEDMSCNDILFVSIIGHGISSYEANPEGLAPGLRYCLSEAKATIPKDKQSSSPVYLGATAGMRLIQ